MLHWEIFLCGILGHYQKWFIKKDENLGVNITLDTSAFSLTAERVVNLTNSQDIINTDIDLMSASLGTIPDIGIEDGIYLWWRWDT